MVSAVRHKIIREHTADMSKPVLRGQFETWFQFRQGLCQISGERDTPSLVIGEGEKGKY